MSEKRIDWSKATQGAIEVEPGKTRVTIRIDDDVLEWFRSKVPPGGGAGYQTAMNAALRAHMLAHSGELETLLRRIVAEELDARVPKRSPPRKRKAS
jgi:hypothetical protein